MWRRLLSLVGKFKRKASAGKATEIFQKKYANFKTILESNSELLKIISDLEEKLGGNRVFPMAYIRSQTSRLVYHTDRMIESFEGLSGRSYVPLKENLNYVRSIIAAEFELVSAPPIADYILPYKDITKDMVATVGGKNANLGEVMNMGITIPKGFVITTRAFQTIIKENDLLNEIMMQKLSINPENPDSIDEASGNIQKMFLNAAVPPSLEQSILGAYEQFVDHRRQTFVSLRSSAVGEDSDISYAGQYLSVLNVPPENIIKEYLKVLSSLFAPKAIFYRLYMGIPFGEADMSVGCLEMVDARSSGVVYSSNPHDRLDNTILINALWGLGTSVVDGLETPDIYKISREPDFRVLSSDIAHKKRQIVTGENGYVTEQPVEAEYQKVPCLENEQAIQLARIAEMIEKHYQCPQDIEWAVDKNDTVIILQARPLRIYGNGLTAADRQDFPGHPLLLENGNIACPGVGFGPAYPVFSEKDIKDFPEGGVLLAPQSSPLYVLVMQKASAIIVDSGSITGHMASLAREFQVPTIVNLKGATAKIQKGILITVDASVGRVYHGKVEELVDVRIHQKDASIIYTPAYKSLKKLSGHIIPLNLTNPNSPAFAPESCRTVHDIMRYIHEKSYAEMFKISDYTTDYGNISVKLTAGLPIDLYVIDLGKGLINSLEEKSDKRKTTIEEVVSIPFKALLTGMLHEDLAIREPKPVSFKGFLSVMSEQMLSPQGNGNERFGEKSYAIISDKYLNFSSRVGYHYSILDAYCGPVINMNYINFTFMGGAAEYNRRCRRARMIQQVLQSIEFLVEVQGDRVTARFAKQPEEIIIKKLDQLGRLIIYTRQMDMLMHAEENVSLLADCFLNEDYTIKIP